MFKNLADTSPNINDSLETNPRNYSSTDFTGNQFKIQSSTFSDDQLHLVTFESLSDHRFENKQIDLQILKIWKKKEKHVYELKQLVHSPGERLES